MGVSTGKTKAELLAAEIARAVNAGKAVQMETVDFNDPDRPLTCLEVDFPIIAINEIAGLEASSGALKKPIYQMSKWWARRQSSVFRSIILAAATKAPDDPAEAAKKVWGAYYCNHQKKGAFKHLKVADIFMGGGTTVVEGSRLGMNMFGIDLNPIAWFVVKQELAKVTLDEVNQLLSDIEVEVKPQIMPFYYCDGLNGERGKWIHIITERIMGDDFDPLSLTPEERIEYRYEGPEIVYTFWAKHGPCQVTGCGHRTPIITSPVIATKTLSVKYWEHRCHKCNLDFDVEDSSVRMAPDVPLVVAETEKPFSILSTREGVICPSCGFVELIKLGKGKNKKIELSLLVHPQWLKGAAKKDSSGYPFGGSAQDNADTTSLWNKERARTIQLLEVRGALPDTVICPSSGIVIKTTKDGGTVPKKSNFACGSCGAIQDVLASIKASKKTGAIAAYAIQYYTPYADKQNNVNSGRYYRPADDNVARQLNAANKEWEERKEGDLAAYWPRQSIPYGFMTSIANGDIREGHGHTHWWTMFNSRQLLVHATILKAICSTGGNRHRQEVREFVIGAFQQFLRCNTLLSIWHLRNNQISAALSNSNFHPKSTSLEPSVFSPVGDGNWFSAIRSLKSAIDWKEHPWELVSNNYFKQLSSQLHDSLSGKSNKIDLGDKMLGQVNIRCGSATDIPFVTDSSIDLVITDPPFGGLLHYSELSDFFYVWLRLALCNEYPDIFMGDHTPKALEVVANKAREPEDADGFYQRLLTHCWREAYRVLKDGGILAFTFHHSEDEPWVAVLESLFDAGFYLEATYPIRSDETKGEGEFGSKQIEYDIIHVCRKRREEPKPISWAKMRRQVIQDVRRLQSLLEHHQSEGLLEADLQVIRRGKALEYFSRHYGKVYVDEGRAITVLDAIAGINQILDEESGNVTDPPPVTAEPFTRQFLRLFDRKEELPRDQMQKFLRGTGISPSEFENRGWCAERNKIYYSISPLEIARGWVGKHRLGMTSDFDQAMFLIGACFDNSGINATETLKNPNFKPHPALSALLEWFSTRGALSPIRNAAVRAEQIYQNWQSQHEKEVLQMNLFFGEGA